MTQDPRHHHFIIQDIVSNPSVRPPGSCFVFSSFRQLTASEKSSELYSENHFEETFPICMRCGNNFINAGEHSQIQSYSQEEIALLEWIYWWDFRYLCEHETMIDKLHTVGGGGEKSRWQIGRDINIALLMQNYKKMQCWCCLIMASPIEMKMKHFCRVASLQMAGVLQTTLSFFEQKGAKWRYCWIQLTWKRK